MIPITSKINLDESELKFSFIRAAGPGGQNVNKVATGVQLRFNVKRSPSLPEDVRTRLIVMLSKRLTLQGDIIIKANRYRTQNKNKIDAINRLQMMILKVEKPPKKRIKTKPSRVAKERRLSEKKAKGQKKHLRRRSQDDF
ncbi:MAG: alternative ribosome rescue aminoacyl-tRNA hydrolase ArfB [Candidatus Berkiellales bacterium]